MKDPYYLLGMLIGFGILGIALIAFYGTIMLMAKWIFNL